MCGQRFALAILTLVVALALSMAAVMAAVPASAQDAPEPPGSVPPQGVLVVALGMSDGMTVLPVHWAPVMGIECGPMQP